MSNFRNIILIGLFSFPITVILSQTYVDSITIVTKFGLYYSKNGKTLSAGKLVNAVKSNPEAYRILKQAKDSHDLGSVMGSIGGFMAGYAIGASLGKKSLDKRTLIFGGTLILFSIPFSTGFNTKAYKAVKIYNEGLRHPQ